MKSVKIILVITCCVIVFVFGAVAGLLSSSFLGTYDKPSQLTIKLIKDMGIRPIHLKVKLDSILAENIKIPFNYIKGQFANPKKIHIMVSNRDMKKLMQERQQIIERGIRIPTDGDWVQADIMHEEGVAKTKVRLKGIWPDHQTGDKWSLRIKVDDNSGLFGMKAFSIQDPKTRYYLSDYFYHKVLEKEGVLSPRYDFIDVTINGTHKGIYVLEEHFDDSFSGIAGQIGGVFLRFNDELFMSNLHLGNIYGGKDCGYDGEINFFPVSNIQTFNTPNILNDHGKRTSFNKARALLESFRSGKSRTHEVFDVDKLARYFAVSTVLGGQHATTWVNIRFYYNPETLLLEPVGYDSNLRPSTYNMEELNRFYPNCIDSSNDNYEIKVDCAIKHSDYYENLFSDSIFFERYINELNRMTDQKYLDGMFFDLKKDMDDAVDILHMDTPSYHFFKDIFYHNQNYIKETLNPGNVLNAYFQGVVPNKGAIQLKVNNMHSLPIEIVGLSNKGDQLAPLGRNVVLQPYFSGNIDLREVDFEMPAGVNWNSEFAKDIKISYKVFGTNKIREQDIIPWHFGVSDSPVKVGEKRSGYVN